MEQSTLARTAIRLLPSLLLALILLAACTVERRNCAEVVVEEVTLCLARGWERVSEEVLREKGVPEETLAAFHRTEAGSGVRDNIVLSRDAFSGRVSDLAYAEANIKAIAATPEYALLEKREVKIEGDVTTLHIFTAKPVPDVPARRFYQLSLVEGNRGYTLTGTLPFAADEEEEQQLTDILLDVRVKEGEGEEQ